MLFGLVVGFLRVVFLLAKALDIEEVSFEVFKSYSLDVKGLQGLMLFSVSYGRALD